jgi:poly [ADP-ribose] polymerase
MQVVKLLKVSGDVNNNKYYEMHENSDGTFLAKFGRVGASPQSASYPMSKWKTKYNEKLKKGYRDVTELSVIVKEAKYKDITDTGIGAIVNALQQYANSSVSKNYQVSAGSVTDKQITQAQLLVDTLPTFSEVSLFNQTLEKLFEVIPRKMSTVRAYLWDGGADAKKRIITREQDTLDVMRGQVVLSHQTEDAEDIEEKSILDIAGINITKITQAEEDEIISQLQDEKWRYRQAFKVENLGTQSKFNAFIKKSNNKKTMLFWHGSRNENWWSILGTGLVLRPANAVITGKMFGYGLYFADKARKSLGYTSLRGSYWACGGSDVGYMSLYEVHVGNWLHSQKHTHEMYNYTYDILQRKGGYDSLFAEGGIDLRNNEYIIYREEQCTVKYIVELKG